MTETESVVAFEGERPRLLRLATRLLGDHAEAEDMVQQAWLRLDRTDQVVNNLPGWLTTATTRLCLDRIRARVPAPENDLEPAELHPDPADEVELADSVGIALAVVLDRLTPAERVAFVLHDTFGFEFTTIAAILESTPTAVRKLASRARTKLAQPAHRDVRTDWQVVDAFLAAARGGHFSQLLELLAPESVIEADAMAVALGTPRHITGRHEVASFFNGAAKTAFPVFIGDRPGAAWVHRGEAKVAFDFTVADGVVSRISFRADSHILRSIRTRKGDASP
ncbi:sigma-70 family RNA polymerase sigma factor [Arthrobacter tumbae]|uniref:sigma-70 family RNA polymerase sigma factor n=1 Tax=Arthrobacter tumbae TaxID=163874 RepID=UPI00195B9211|nr:sigma-70 family RNA polymerase sigma factor [Arthrobacter tumbae]MBM7782347.1 RNA polymerase sigma-70 factor (ECF subfamily) [Arthrobacter tumbae]